MTLLAFLAAASLIAAAINAALKNSRSSLVRINEARPTGR